MRICRVTTVPFFLIHHLHDQIQAAIGAGNEVFLVSSNDPDAAKLEALFAAKFHAIEIPRKISLYADLLALIQLYRFFRRSNFDIVHSATPKAGLLCAIAGLWAGVPVRLHTFTGQPWANLRGVVRWVAKLCDWLIVKLNTRSYTDSASQRAFLVSEGIANEGKLVVLGAGSLAGVDLQKFDSARFDKKAIKDELSLPEDTKVIAFVGRVTRDKGVVELITAFEQLRSSGMNVFLLLVGPFEPERDPLPESIVRELLGNPHVRVIGYAQNPEKYLAVADLLCLPSYREGFGNVVIEAAAMGVPAVATRIVGLCDSVADGVTGVLVAPRDVAALAGALDALLTDDGKRVKMANEARARAARLFDSKVVNALMLEEYKSLTEDRLHGWLTRK